MVDKCVVLNTDLKKTATALKAGVFSGCTSFAIKVFFAVLELCLKISKIKWNMIVNYLQETEDFRLEKSLIRIKELLHLCLFQDFMFFETAQEHNDWWSGLTNNTFYTCLVNSDAHSYIVCSIDVDFHGGCC